MIPYTYEFPRPAVTVDCIVQSFDGSQIWVLLIRRAHDPFAGCWALPGGFIEMGETLVASARRELFEETNLCVEELRQFRTFGDPGRDPRGRTVTIVFFGWVPWEVREPKAADDAREAAWLPLTGLPELAFDHAQVLKEFRAFLRQLASTEPLGKDALPRTFELPVLVRFYEAIFGCGRRARQVVRTLRSLGIIRAAPGSSKALARSKQLYRFDLRKYRQYQIKGFGAVIKP